MFKIFYSWQADLHSGTNRNFILNSIEKACSKIKSEGGIAVEPVVDRDTLGLSGAPNISEAILSKIRDADAFIADVSLINTRPSQEVIDTDAELDIYNLENPNYRFRPTPNPNVLIELGYALSHLGNEAIILIINTHYGSIEQLPFDLRSLRTLSYSLPPAQTDKTQEKQELITDFTKAINGIASVVRADPVHSIIFPRTKQVVGQAEGMLRELISAAGKTFDPETITYDEVVEICESVNPNDQAQFIIGGNPYDGFQYGNHIAKMYDWRERSKKFTSDIFVFNVFLKREHIALLANIEQCHYFVALETARNYPIRNTNLSWLSNSMWKYIIASRQLKEYAASTLARRAENL